MSHHLEDSMTARATANSLRQSVDTRVPEVQTLERRVNELEQLATSQRRELAIQFERIAQLQAEWDILRIRFIKA